MDSPSFEAISLRTSSTSSMSSYEDLTMETCDNRSLNSSQMGNKSSQFLQAVSVQVPKSDSTLPPDNSICETNSSSPTGQKSHFVTMAGDQPTTSRTIDTRNLLDIVLPVERDLCWRCGFPGHHRQNCTKPRLLFCSRCGTIGILSRNCTCDKYRRTLRHTAKDRSPPYHSQGNPTTVQIKKRPPCQSQRRRSKQQRTTGRCASFTHSKRSRTPVRPVVDLQRNTSSIGVQACIFPIKATRTVGSQTVTLRNGSRTPSRYPMSA